MRSKTWEPATIWAAVLRGLASLALTLTFFPLSPAAAQQPQVQKPPGVGYVYPPVIRPGTTTDVILGGFDWTDDLEWFVQRSDVHLEPLGPPGDYILTPPPYWMGPRSGTPPQPIPREVAARIRVDAAAPPGLVRWQVANANGASSTAVFLISAGNELTETRSRELPQRLPDLPVAVSGRLSRLTEVDRYEIVAARDGSISVDLTARRLGSKFQGQIEVRDAAGVTVADFADTQGLDGGLTFSARSGETYTVSLHDVDFRGDRSFLYRLEFAEAPADSAPLTSSAEGLSIAASAESPSMISPPAAVTGRLETAEPDPRYAWASAEKESWTVSLKSREIGGTLDLALKVLDPDGKVVAESDDQSGGLDPLSHFTAAKTGKYLAVIHTLTTPSDRATDHYRLEVRRQTPDFELRMPQTIDLPLGGKAAVKIVAERFGGFSGPIVLQAESLPTGVSAAGEWTIPAEKNELAVTLEAAADADVVGALIQVRGTATIGEQSVTKGALAAAAGSLAPATPDESLTPLVLLAVTMPPPFEIRVVDRERQREVHRGTTYPAELEIHRLDSFQGAMQIAMNAQQDRDRQGVRGPLLPVPAEAMRVLYPCTMPEWLGTELTRRIVVHGVAPVADPKGRIRYLTRAADARITMIMEGALLKLSCEESERGHGREEPARPGDTIEIPVSVSRSVKLPPQETTVELEIPDELIGLLEAAPVLLPAGTDSGRLTLRTVADARLKGDWTLRLRATTLQEGTWPVISYADLRLAFP